MALICTLTTVAIGQGVPRVVAGRGIPYPLGKPGASPSAELRMREERVRKALALLCSEISGPTVVE